MKHIIYQLFIRAFGNRRECLPGGSYALNGSGKFNNITDDCLQRLKELSITHIWYTGVIAHAGKTLWSGYHNAHPAVVKGEAGSPYAITDYYDVAAELAENLPSRMEEFGALVDRTHRASLKVLIDFVPNHLSRCYWSLGGGEDTVAVGRPGAFGAHDDKSLAFSPQNNFYYLPGQELHLPESAQRQDNGVLPYREFPARVTGNDCFSAWPSANDWYDTVKLNYGVDYACGQKHFEPMPKTWGMMLDVLRFWCSKGVDGFRCDMAEMVPVEFWHWAISELRRDYPQVFLVAEIYNPSLYDSYLNYGGFDLLYDKVGMYDTLKAVSRGEAPAWRITSAWQSVDSIQNRMLNFLENHDEQRIASDFNLGSAISALPELAVSLLFNRASFMLYCGEEYGERGMLQEGYSGFDGRTSIFDYCSIPSVVKSFWGGNGRDDMSDLLYGVYCRLLHLANAEPAIWDGYTYDLVYCNSHLSSDKFIFARRPRRSFSNLHPKEEVVVVCADFSRCSNLKEFENEQIAVNLPANLFAHWNIPEGDEYSVEYLFGGENCNSNANGKSSLLLSSSQALNLKVGKLGVTVIRLSKV